MKRTIILSLILVVMLSGLVALASTRSQFFASNLSFYDPVWNDDFQIGPWARCPMLAIQQDASIGKIFYDDFYGFPSTKAAKIEPWVIVEDDGAAGTDATQDRNGGWYKHYCDEASDNDEAYIATTGESWVLGSDKPLWFEVRTEWTNSGSTLGAFIVGIMEGGGDTGTLQDDEGGPPDDYDGFCFFKEKGDTSVSFESSIATDQVTNTSFADFTSGDEMVLSVYWDGVATITPYIDGIAGTAHTMATTGGECNAVFGVKSDGSAEEFIEIDYIKVVHIY